MAESKRALLPKKNKYSSFVFLSLMHPTPDKFKAESNSHSQKSVYDKVDSHANSHLIHVDYYDDFEKQNDQFLIKESCQEKYAPLLGADAHAKIAILAHGNYFQANKLFAERETYPDATKRIFDVTMIAALIKHIPNIKISQESERPERNLQISLYSCYGENFATSLMQELISDPTGVYPCTITTGKKDFLLCRTDLGHKRKYYLSVTAPIKNNLPVMALGWIIYGVSFGIDDTLTRNICNFIGILMVLTAVFKTVFWDCAIKPRREKNNLSKIVITAEKSEGKLEIKKQNKTEFKNPSQMFYQAPVLDVPVSSNSSTNVNSVV